MKQIPSTYSTNKIWYIYSEDETTNIENSSFYKTKTLIIFFLSEQQ